MDRNKFNIDAIVVGAGPAGIAAALTIKRGGKSVVVLERASNLGSKNMFGGALYLNSIKSILPETYQNAPYERFITQHTYSFLNAEGGSVEIKSTSKDIGTATVFRPKFDTWLTEEAKKEGVFIAHDTLVEKLIFKNGAIIGVQTEQEKYYAPIVILADGANSLLARSIHLRRDYFPRDMVLSVKETLKLNKDTLEERFNLAKNSTSGAMYEFFGGLTDFYDPDKPNKKRPRPVTPFAIGFLYTYKDAISVGLGVSLEDLNRYKIKPYELLDKLKSHPAIKPLIQNAEEAEYSAHLIPEFGYKGLPRLYSNGVMIAGDAAGLINSAHFEGTNFAIESGRLAGETAVIALNLGNCSHNILKIYEKKLRKSFVLKDLKAYRNVVETLYQRKKSILNFYPNQMGKFMELIHHVDNTEKKAKFRKFIKGFVLKRSFIELFRDIKAGIKLVIDIIF